MDSITRNYHAHGGNEWVIGGKLTFLPGATVEGAEGLFDLPNAAEPVRLEALADSEERTVAALRASLRQLLLRKPRQPRPNRLRNHAHGV